MTTPANDANHPPIIRTIRPATETPAHPMNAYEIAELTSVLNQHGMANRLRIQETPGNWRHISIQDRNGEVIASIRPDRWDTGYIACYQHNTYDGYTRAEALDNMMDDLRRELDGNPASRNEHA